MATTSRRERNYQTSWAVYHPGEKAYKKRICIYDYNAIVLSNSLKDFKQKKTLGFSLKDFKQKKTFGFNSTENKQEEL
jgi:hypothetical protein